jgi:hypothetical protein
MKASSIMPYVFILILFMFGISVHAVYVFKHFNF